jgi:hypothetical protein
MLIYFRENDEICDYQEELDENDRFYELKLLINDMKEVEPILNSRYLCNII